ncbi:MAG: hypothetical protein HYW56_02685 [Candidatus Harrisonbacteria bacterium]|nr:hypothetical protein [Candidatus Harrisonbacteria bacterium]
MAKIISADQRFALLTALAANADWGSLTVEMVQLGITEAQRAGAEFTAFVKNGFRMQIADFLRNTGELTIRIPALPRPTLAQLQAKYPWIASIERDCSPTVKVTMNLATVLRADEMDKKQYINGEEYERRLASCLNDLLGFQHLTWLVEHQDESPAFNALLGKIYVDGPGIVVADANGIRRVPYLHQDGPRWKLRWHWLGFVFYSLGRVGSSRK